MTDPQAVPAAFNPGGYPVQAQVTTPASLERWRVLQYFLAIPHLIVMMVLLFAANIAGVVAWFAILFTGEHPEGLWDFVAGVHRWSYRVMTYSLFLHTEYPRFELASGGTDPGTLPALFAVVRPTERNRLTCALRQLWAIPAALFMFVVILGVYVMAIVGWFAVLFTGSWPEGPRAFVDKGLRAYTRYFAYASLLVDEYPPFELD